jgi:hypothetical protein
MLVRFDSKVGTFTMFGDVAVELLRMMGHSGTIPSALLAADIPAALARLKPAVARAPEPPAPPPEPDGRPAPPPVSVRQRAFPLIDLLERAAKANADVLWDKA